MISGQTNLMQNQTKTVIAIAWPIRVILMSTRILLVLAALGALRRRRPSSAAARLLQLRDERIGEREVERDADADHRDRVEQCDDEEHLGPQHARELGLTSRAFEPAAAEKPHADADAERAEADQNRHGDGRHTNHDVHLCLQSRRILSFEKLNALRPCRALGSCTRSSTS